LLAGCRVSGLFGTGDHGVDRLRSTRSGNLAIWIQCREADLPVTRTSIAEWPSQATAKGRCAMASM
jgi:hypothetical protein